MLDIQTELKQKHKQNLMVINNRSEQRCPHIQKRRKNKKNCQNENW